MRDFDWTNKIVVIKTCYDIALNFVFFVIMKPQRIIKLFSTSL